jgi:Protein of unknown function (DUF3108)
MTSAAAAEVNRVEARFEIFGFAGIHILTDRTTVEETGNRHSIAMDLDTRGIARVFVNLTSHSEVRGRLSQDASRPESYRPEVRRNGTERRYVVDYRNDGTVINGSTPYPIDGSLLTPTEQIRGAVDQLTAYFILERQLPERGTRTLLVPVFDGSGFYNVRFPR